MAYLRPRFERRISRPFQLAHHLVVVPERPPPVALPSALVQVSEASATQRHLAAVDEGADIAPVPIPGVFAVEVVVPVDFDGHARQQPVTGRVAAGAHDALPWSRRRRSRQPSLTPSMRSIHAFATST